MSAGRISDQIYVIPFGRYTAASDVAPPANQVLVGRESQRAYLIEMLISAGRRGAFLVTGRRGAGKTSFVRHCIGEYQAAVFNRFLRANVGRGVLDRAFVLFFVLLTFLAGLLASELLQIIDFRRPSPVAWFLFALVGIALFYPAIYAKLVIETILLQALRRRARTVEPEAVEPEAVTAYKAAAGATLAVLISAFLLWRFGLHEPPSVTLAFLLAWTAGIYCCVQAFSFYIKDTKDSEERTDDSAGVKGARKRVFISSIALALSLIAVSVLLKQRRPDALVPFFFLSSLLSGAAGLLFRHRRLLHLSSQPQYPAKAFQSAATSYLLPGLLPIVVLFAGLLVESWPIELAVLISVVSIAVLRLLYRPRRLPPSFYPPPSAVLVPKALFSIVIALQLASPVLTHLAQLLPESAILSALFGQHSTGDWLFVERSMEVQWLLLSLLLVGVFSFLEYEWIVRPYEWERKHAAHDAGTPVWAEAPAGLADDTAGASEATRHHRALASLTLPWLIYRLWLPSVVVSVNLGFDRLGHSQVVQAMLVGLRDRYYRSFLAWSSGFANLGRLLGALLLFGAVTITGRIWFQPPSPADILEALNTTELGKPHARLAKELSTDPVSEEAAAAQEAFDEAVREFTKREPKAVRQPLSTCDFIRLATNLHTPTTASIICSTGDLWFNILYYNLLPSHQFSAQSRTGALLIHQFLPFSPGEPQRVYLSHDAALLPTGTYFAVYHVALFIFFFFIGRWMFRRIPALPYHQNLRRIDDILDSLSARQRTTSRTDLWGPARWIYSLFTDERVRESERDPLDPRAVELAFLEVLEEIQKGGIRLPGAARHHLTIPSPEITFVFDELDKLGTRADPEESPILPESAGIQKEVVHHDRLRSIRLRSLLSDLKNILSSAPARFIFVGGRNLHDEWLADHTTKQPLLTSIFNAEVYLPSLLTDRAESKPSEDLTDLVRRYFLKHLERSRILYDMWVLRRWRPSFGLWIESREHDTFAQGGSPPNDLEVYKCAPAPSSVSPIRLDSPVPGLSENFLKDFINFLAFRSMGNPKQLSELLTTLIAPARAWTTQDVQECRNFAASRHMLEFGDHAIFRIQLVSDIYRHLAARFHPRMAGGEVSRSSTSVDDKYAISLFFMTDFLFKFHRRAFSWSNLERVDDLANIHRLPDLREMQAELVEHFSERFLHRVLNGMYSFRFRSDIAREVEYISRKSPFELAALNFTLDESQSLKGLYQAALKEQGEENADLLGGLGELYDFDQEFEPARFHYRKALALLDRNLFGTVRGLAEPAYGQDDYSVIRSILAGNAPRDARMFLSWGAARLRLMLQIALTYERERNLERAATEYRDARTLARALVKASIPPASDAGRPWYEDPEDSPGRPRQQRVHTLKGLHLFFQPVFAEAWLSEKVVGVVDTSATLVERSLAEIRGHLPYVRRPISIVAEDPRKPLHGNFLLTLSQLHNRAGDLYFFKGRQPASEEVISDLLKEEVRGESTPGSDCPTDGYIVRAHYHYAVAMHEIRRYVWYRVESSPKLSISKSPAPTLVAEALPDFVYRAAAGSLNDMAETTLARVSLTRLSRRLRRADANSTRKLIGVLRLDLGSQCPRWLGQRDKPSDDALSNWFGVWLGISGEKGKLVSFEGRDPDEQRLLMSLKLCFVGSNLFAEGGYPEDAGREFLQICDTVTRYLWWRRTFQRVARGNHARNLLGKRWESLLSELPSEIGARRSRLEQIFWSQLITLGIQALERADHLFRESRGYAARERAGTGSQKYLLGEVLPVNAMTLLCSLALGAGDILDEKQKEAIKKLRTGWLGQQDSIANEDDFATPLRRSLERHRYPMINRLHGIKVLVDHAAVTDNIEGIADFTGELLDLSSQFDAPLHFTPLHSGTTCALVWIACQERPEAQVNGPDLDRIKRAALHDLRVSEEMYTMRRSYYEAISDLYYLYDDFNDRQIHFNHAIQMAGSELAAILRYLVENWDESKDGTAQEGTTAPPPAAAG